MKAEEHWENVKQTLRQQFNEMKYRRRLNFSFVLCRGPWEAHYEQSVGAGGYQRKYAEFKALLEEFCT